MIAARKACAGVGEPRYKIGSVIEAGENWAIGLYRHSPRVCESNRLTFNRHGLNLDAEKPVAPGTKFVIEGFGTKSSYDGIGIQLASIGSFKPVAAFISQLNDDGTYNPEAQKLFVDMGVYRSCHDLIKENIPVVKQMKMNFI